MLGISLVIIIKQFHRLSALLHLLGQVISRDAFSHLWMVNAHCVSPDHYALSIGTLAQSPAENAGKTCRQAL